MHSARYAFVAGVEYSEGTFVMTSSSASRMTSTSSGSKCGIGKTPMDTKMFPLSTTNARPHGSSRFVSRRAKVRGPATLQMSFPSRSHDPYRRRRMPLEDDEQREPGERRDHHRSRQ